MKINLRVGDELKGTGCIITHIYPNFIICATPDKKRSVTFSVGDYVSNQLDTRPIWEQMDDFLLEYDCGYRHRL